MDDNTLQTIKDIVLIVVPIITAYFTYRTNKKSKKELNAELEVHLKEQDNETANELKKMQKQLEVQNMQSSWETSTPTTQKYIDEAGAKRYGSLVWAVSLRKIGSPLLIFIMFPLYTVATSAKCSGSICVITAP